MDNINIIRVIGHILVFVGFILMHKGFEQKSKLISRGFHIAVVGIFLAAIVPMIWVFIEVLFFRNPVR
jgi:hypothetical protein